MKTHSTNLSDTLAEYYQNKKCLPAFNFNDVWDVQAICNAAQKQKQPIWLMAYTKVVEALSFPKTSGTSGLDLLVAIANCMKKRYSIPIFLHLDHCSDVQLCLQAVDAGFDSVMFDGSALSLEKNIQKTKEVCLYAHKKGVLVEAEIGKIRGRGNDSGDFLAAVSDVEALAQQAKPDLIAVGVGTAHGFYEGKPENNFQRLEEIHSVVQMPLVLHGGTGIAKPDILRSISLGIAKVNIGTAIHTAYMQNLAKQIEKDGLNAYPPSSITQILPQVEAEVAKYLDMF